jgi:hypothetical protein
VAELVDALGSGSSGGILVKVRVFSSAPKLQGCMGNQDTHATLFYFLLSAVHR